MTSPLESDGQTRWCSRGHRLAMILLLLMLSVIPMPSQAQSEPAEAGVPIAFFRFLAARLSGPTPSSEQVLASNLGVDPTDLRLIMTAAQSFVAEESRLREEAVAYTRTQDLARKPHDAAMIRSFTTRRSSMAQAAVGQLRSRLSPKGSEAVLRLLGGIRQGTTVWK